MALTFLDLSCLLVGLLLFRGIDLVLLTFLTYIVLRVGVAVPLTIV